MRIATSCAPLRAAPIAEMTITANASHVRERDGSGGGGGDNAPSVIHTRSAGAGSSRTARVVLPGGPARIRAGAWTARAQGRGGGARRAPRGGVRGPGAPG